MGYAGGGEIDSALNRVENHAKIEEAFRKYISLGGQGRRAERNHIFGHSQGKCPTTKAPRIRLRDSTASRRLRKDHGVTICMELLNSKVDHKDYMCDHTAWGVRVVEAVNSPRVKLLYDIYHMQIMEGDLVRTIQAKHPVAGPLPHRGRSREARTGQYAGSAVGRGDARILASNFQGYVAHEFVPTRDPLTSLRQAVDLCDV